jgi:hypothetical protein
VPWHSGHCSSAAISLPFTRWTDLAETLPSHAVLVRVPTDRWYVSSAGPRDEEVAAVNVSTWALLSGVVVGR